MNENVCEQFIRQMVGQMRETPLEYDVLGQRGQTFKTLAPTPPERGLMGQCYHNAWDLAQRDGMIYVEGYACKGDIPLPMHHAWCVDASGRVHDATWADGHSYFGVAFDHDAVLSILDYTGTYSVFGNLHALRPMSVDEIRVMLLQAAIPIQPTLEAHHAAN